MTDHYRPMIPVERLFNGPIEFAGETFHREDVNRMSISIDTVLTREVDGETYRTQIDSNGSTWGGEPPMPLDRLLDRLKSDPLDRARFQRFAYRQDHDWLRRCWPHVGEVWGFFGNFATYSHVFHIVTDDPHVIDVLRRAIRLAQCRADYRALPAYVPPARRRSRAHA